MHYPIRSEQIARNEQNKCIIFIPAESIFNVRYALRLCTKIFPGTKLNIISSVGYKLAVIRLLV